MFCGDDTGAVIGEIAGCHSRFGNSGEDLPKYQVPSSVVVAGGKTYVGETGVSLHGQEGKVMNPMADGKIANWDHVEKLWEQHESSKYQDFIKDRIATISGKIGVIHVGGNSDIEQKEKKDRVEDSVCATRAALEDGILAGGGIVLREIADDLAKLGNGQNQRVAIKILEDSLKAPFRQILTNAGLDYKTIEPNLDPGVGYDVKKDQYGNMLKLGIIDPSKVTKTAVKSAISIASTILSTNAIITNLRDLK